MKRRELLLMGGVGGGTFLLGAFGCASPQIVVAAPFEGKLGNSVLSVQVTAERGLLGPLSPTKRYAEWMQVRLKNRLIESGFTLKEKTADFHLHLVVESVTTGSGNNKAECRGYVRGYRKWPGDMVEMQNKQFSTTVPVALELKVDVVKKRLPQGYKRELLAEEAAKAAVDLVVDYLKQVR